MAYSKAELGAEFGMLTKGILQDATVDTIGSILRTLRGLK